MYMEMDLAFELGSKVLELEKIVLELKSRSLKIGRTKLSNPYPKNLQTNLKQN
jgi:hypothetical protein